MRKGRGKDHVWQLVKFKGDIAIYAKCSCGYRYLCKNPMNTNAAYLFYNYCPYCGSRKTRYIPTIKKIEKFSWEIS